MSPTRSSEVVCDNCSSLLMDMYLKALFCLTPHPLKCDPATPAGASSFRSAGSKCSVCGSLHTWFVDCELCSLRLHTSQSTNRMSRRLRRREVLNSYFTVSYDEG